MFRFGYKSLLVVVSLILGTAPLAAYYYSPSNQPPGPPPNYDQLDPAVFYGEPPLGQLAPGEKDGYFIWFDNLHQKWSIVSRVPYNASVYEQFHGSILVQMDEEPQPGINVFPVGFGLDPDLHRNDRWGWVKWPESIAPDLYEIWWDVTLDCAGSAATSTLAQPQSTLLNNSSGAGTSKLSQSAETPDQTAEICTSCPPCIIGISFLGCAFDFNLWGSSYHCAYGADKLYAGANMVPVSTLFGYSDTYEGIEDLYGHPFECTGDGCLEPNRSIFTPVTFPGAAYNVDGKILPGTDYGDAYGGSRVYEGNGIQFSINDCGGNEPPYFDPPLGGTLKTVSLCLGGTIYDTITAGDPDAGDVITLAKITGPGVFSTTPGNAPVYGYYEFSPEQPGVYVLVVEASDDQGATTLDSLVYEVTMNYPPVLTGGDTTVTSCWTGQEICLSVGASDTENDLLTYTLLSGTGVLDPVSGKLCFTPDEPGVYRFEVAVADSCGADTAAFTVTVDINHDPMINGFDSLVALCEADTICFDVSASDLDLDDSLDITFISGPGEFIQTANGLGQHCFLPEGQSGRYVFVFQVTDECWRYDGGLKLSPPVPPRDSIIIIVEPNQPPTIVCPDDTSESICEPDTLCYQITATDPDQDQLTFNLLSGPGNIDPVTGLYCFYADAAGDYMATFSVTDTCGLADTCSFMVSVALNEPPQVTIEDDTYDLCEPQEICLPFAIDDPDQNIVDIQASSTTTDVYLLKNTACFTPTTAGVYDIIITVTDICGATAIDTAFVTVSFDDAPMVICPSPGPVHLCEPGTITLPLTYSPADADFVVTPSATYADGMVSFFADTAGTYCFDATATTSCGNYTCSFCVTVTIDSPPTVTIADTTLLQCELSEICLPYEMSDPDDNIVSVTITPTNKSLNRTEGFVCFVPYKTGHQEIVIAVADSCGNVAVDTAMIDITLNQGPTASLENTTFNLCESGEICLPLTMDDIDGKIDSVIVEEPAWYNSETQSICLMVDSTKIYEIFATVYDDCGASVTVTGRARVIINTPPLVIAPPDTSVFQCELSEICLDGFVFSDREHNIVNVEFIPDMGNYAKQSYCFTPTEAGTFCIIARATDECGEISEDTVCVTVELGEDAVIDCPDGPQMISLCDTATVCLDISVNPATANVSVLEPEAAYSDGKLCFFAGEAGVYTFTLVAEGECSTDTCMVTFEVTINEAPVIVCPPSSAIHLCEADTVMIPLSYLPLNAELTIDPPAIYEDGMIKFFADTSGSYCYTIIAENECGADTCIFCIDITFDSPPVVDTNGGAYYLCEPERICIPVTYSDPDGNIVSVTVEPSEFTIENQSVCFMPEGPGEYTYILTVEDACGNVVADTSTIVVDLNLGPTVDIGDSTFFICEPTEICLAANIFDPDGQIDSIIVPDPWSYDSDRGVLCRTVDEGGYYPVAVRVVDDCGVSAVDSGAALIQMNTVPTTSLPNDTSLFLCEPIEICFPVVYGDIDNNIKLIDLSPEFSLVDGEACFTPDAAGTYELIVTVTDSCGMIATDTMKITVDLNQAPMVSVDDTTLFSCEPVEICLPVTAFDPEDRIQSINTSDPWIYHIDDNTVCLTVTESGSYDVTFTVVDECGVEVSDRGTAQVTINTPPYVAAPNDTSVFQCEPIEICLSGFEIGDAEDNITNLEFIPDNGTYIEGAYCFMPDTAGQYCLIVRATDECGEVAEDTVCVTYAAGEDVSIACPDGPVMKSMCEPEEVCVDIPIEPVTATVVVLEQEASYSDGALCFTPPEAGVYEFTVIATGECDVDTCKVTFDITFEDAPMLTCPPDDSLKLCAPGSISVPLGVMPADAMVSITPDAEYADGMITFNAEVSGEYCFEVVADNQCGSDTCSFCITVTIDQPPMVTVGDTTLFQCTLEEVCVPYSFSDPDNNVASVTVRALKNDMDINQTEGSLCFVPDYPGLHELEITVTDSCGNSAADTAMITITLNENPVILVDDTSAFLCEPTELCVFVNKGDPDGDVDSVVVQPPAYFNSETSTACLMVSESGVYPIIATVYDDCGAAVTDTGHITARYNIDPMVFAPNDTTIVLCGPSEICLDGFVVYDVEYDIASAEIFPDLGGTYEDGQYCFTPAEPGHYQIRLRVFDGCGAMGEDTVNVTVEFAPEVSLTCPEGIQYFSICETRTICIDVPVTPADADVTVLGDGGSYSNGQVCFDANTAGTYEYTIIATGLCNADTCIVTADVSLGEIPEIACPQSGETHVCGPDSITVPLSIMPPSELLVTPEASLTDSTLTFYADAEGEYCFQVVAIGECGNDTCDFCITVTFDSPPVVTAPDSSMYLCAAEEICVPVIYSDPDNNIATVEVSEGFTIDNGSVCFLPAAPGLYEFIITVIDSCGNQTIDTGSIDVTMNVGPSVTVADSSIFLCEAADICLEISMDDPDGTIDSVVVSEPWYYDIDNQRVCLSATIAGSYDVTVTVYDDCGVSASDVGSVTIKLNTGPSVEFGDYPAEVTLCELTEICLPITIADIDENIDSIYWSSTCSGEFFMNEARDSICWIPAEFGLCTITVVVKDDCGGSDTAVAEIQTHEAPMPNPPCPHDTTIYACASTQVCVEIGPEQPGSNITVRPNFYNYQPETDQICYFATTNRVDTVYVIDSTECGKDSCWFVLTTVMNRPPVLAGEAPEEIEFCHLANLCVEYTVSDPDNNLDTIRLVSDCPNAVLDIANDRVCLEITTALDCEITIIAIDECGKADSLTLPIRAVANRPPNISLPHIETVVRCEDDNSAIIIPDFCITDPDYDELTLVLDSGLGEFTLDPLTNCGQLTFTPPTNDTAEYCFRFMGTDLCDTIYETWCLNVLQALVCSTCVEVSIDDFGCVNSGQVATLQVHAEAYNSIAAYDLLVGYDATVLDFLRADVGGAIDGWEYFTYRFGDVTDCESPCPSGLIRLVAIADINNGPHHPPLEQLDPAGALATIKFRVSSNINYGGMTIPVEFIWSDCGDNGFSDPSGQYLYMDHIIYTPEGNIVWDELNDGVYPESSRPLHVGSPDTCLIGDKYEPIRCVSFRNGEICITHPDSIDARGDLNLNGVAYEIADAVVYTNYFIRGLNAFTIAPAGQIAASDVNADGLTLSIADLVFLIRIITGDASPIPKVLPTSLVVGADCAIKNNDAVVTLSSPEDIGGALLVFDCDGQTPEPVLADGIDGMEMKYGYENGFLRVLIFSFEPGAKILAGETDIVKIPIADNGTVKLVDMDVADYYGRVLASSINNSMLPQRLELTQNYPNPFNPTTTFELALPVASDYSVAIYNVTGQVIRTWAGYSEAGYVTFEWNGCDESGSAVASGIYFYRAQAAGREAIKKMMLIK